LAAVGILVLVNVFSAILALFALHALFLLLGYIKTIVSR
jgi:hypothetical protein